MLWLDLHSTSGHVKEDLGKRVRMKMKLSNSRKCWLYLYSTISKTCLWPTNGHGHWTHAFETRLLSYHTLLLGCCHPAFLGLVWPFSAGLSEAPDLWVVALPLPTALIPWSVFILLSLKTSLAGLDSNNLSIMRHQTFRHLKSCWHVGDARDDFVGWSVGGQTAVRLSQQCPCSFSLDL